MTNPPQLAQINVDEATRLLDRLELDLKASAGDPKGIETLMSEVNELRAVLNAANHSNAALHSRLHGMRERLHSLSDELIGDAFQASRYLSELGRILGLG
jgi:hypothetical protein